MKSESFMMTYTGAKIYPAHPEKSTIELEDITWALAHTPRFGGHTITPYSVAQHCLFCYEQLKSNCSTLTKLYVLLHDAAEAYLGDLPTPVKVLFPSFLEIEDRWLEEIYKSFNLPTDIDVEINQIVKQIDRTALYVEAQKLTIGHREWVPKDFEFYDNVLNNLLIKSSSQIALEFKRTILYNLDQYRREG